MRQLIFTALFGSACLADAHTVGVDGAAASAWRFESWVLALLALSACVYAAGMRNRWRASAQHRNATRQAACFAFGWLTLAAVLGGPIEQWSEHSFAMHMLQHEVLMLVSAPLLVWSRPLATWAWALPQAHRARLHPLRDRAWLAHAWRGVTGPLGALLLQLVVIWLWHAPRLFDAAVRDPWVHAAQHASFLVGALCFWWATLRSRRAHYAGKSTASLFLTMLITGALGALLTFAPSVWYDAYAHATSPWGLTPLEEQQLGGLIMWIPGGTVYFATALWLLQGFLRPELAPRR
jgi:putative membrane protein